MICPRCHAAVTPIYQDAEVPLGDGVVDAVRIVAGWVCDNDHTLLAGEPIDDRFEGNNELVAANCPTDLVPMDLAGSDERPFWRCPECGLTRVA